MLAQYFVEQSCEINDVPLKMLSQSALRLLMDYEWPGNIRHLQNAIEHAVAMSGDSTDILAEFLPDEILAARTEPLRGRIRRAHLRRRCRCRTCRKRASTSRRRCRRSSGS